MMSAQLSLARAAQLVGLPRSALQRMIGRGELASGDGLIALDELQRAFPQAVVGDAGALEKVDRIRTEAFGRRVRERMLPSQEVLAQRLFAQGQELADLRRALQAYHALVLDTLRRLRAAGSPQADAHAAELQAGLQRALGQAPAPAIDAMANLLGIVSAQVTVRPSGRQFIVEGTDSILQAGLKAGLRLAYGCGSGNCGLCKARVVGTGVGSEVGSVTRQIIASDYPLSAQEKAQGVCLLCAHTAVSDLVIETLEAAGPQDLPEQQIGAQVRALRSLGADTLLLHLQTPRSNRLRFLAGQSVTLGVAADGLDLQATLPLASCPCDERNLHFHLRRDLEPGDPAADFAQWAFSGRLREGNGVNLRGPVGEFVLDARADPPRPLLLLGCDTGFAPLRSLIEHALAGEQIDRIDLHWLATRPDGHYEANQCRAWSAALDHFAHRLASAADAADGARVLVAGAAGAVAGRDVYVAGPAAFVDAALRALRARPAAGTDDARLFDLVV